MNIVHQSSGGVCSADTKDRFESGIQHAHGLGVPAHVLIRRNAVDMATAIKISAVTCNEQGRFRCVDRQKVGSIIDDDLYRAKIGPSRGCKGVLSILGTVFVLFCAAVRRRSVAEQTLYWNFAVPIVTYVDDPQNMFIPTAIMIAKPL